MVCFYYQFYHFHKPNLEYHENNPAALVLIYMKNIIFSVSRGTNVIKQSNLLLLQLKKGYVGGWAVREVHQNGKLLGVFYEYYITHYIVVAFYS